MVYLVRTMQYLKFDESFEGATGKLVKHLRESCPQVKEMRVLWNVPGPINEVHWVLAFESLAAEDDWASKIVKDEIYLNWMMKAEGLITPGVDRLYRDAVEMG